MMTFMLAKLETQMRQTTALQKSGNLPVAIGGFELIFEALHFYEGLGYNNEITNIQRLALEAQPSPEMVLYCHALIQFYRHQYASAAEAVKASLSLAPEMPFLYLLQARILTALGNYSEAFATFQLLQELDPASGSARDGYYMLAAEQEMPGEDYYTWLQRFHDWIKPASYIEIGLGHGRSLALSGTETRAIGVDPYQGEWERLNYVSPHGAATLFPLTSDDFFVKNDLKKIIGQETFDLAFIDGLHLFEQALKDFINLERYAHKDSVILIHDCLPIAPLVAERDRCTGFWTGDVWRIIPCLKTFRPDLEVVTIPTKPSGLGVVTNLDSTSAVLAENYDEIVRYYLSLNCPESFEQRLVVCNVVPADEGYFEKLLMRKLKPLAKRGGQ